MNIFRCTPDRSLDKQYLRVCAVYRLFIRKGCIGKGRAVELLSQRKVKLPERLVGFWLANPPHTLTSD